MWKKIRAIEWRLDIQTRCTSAARVLPNLPSVQLKDTISFNCHEPQLTLTLTLLSVASESNRALGKRTDCIVYVQKQGISLPR